MLLEDNKRHAPVYFLVALIARTPMNFHDSMRGLNATHLSLSDPLDPWHLYDAIEAPIQSSTARKLPRLTAPFVGLGVACALLAVV